jgi:hypothetical protein
MDRSLSELFVLLALNPEKGRIGLNDIHFRYSLTGALFMEYHQKGEFLLENKRVVPSFRNNGEIVHDMIADRINKSSRKKRLRSWISRITNKHRMIFREITNKLEKDNILRIEHKKFLNIIPYKRYWLRDITIRHTLIENLREILLYSKKPTTNDVMLLGLAEASKAYSLLSNDRGESKELRKRNSELLKGDILSAEISQTIRDIQAAIVASVIAASTAGHSSH